MLKVKRSQINLVSLQNLNNVERNIRFRTRRTVQPRVLPRSKYCGAAGGERGVLEPRGGVEAARRRSATGSSGAVAGAATAEHWPRRSRRPASGQARRGTRRPAGPPSASASRPRWYSS